MNTRIFKSTIARFRIAGFICALSPLAFAQSGVRSTLTTTAPDGTVSLVIPNDPLPIWNQLKFTPAELANPLISGSGADPDYDGLPNIIERIMGFDPKTKNFGQPSFLRNPNGTLSLRFDVVKSASDIDPLVEFSPNLTHWYNGEDYTNSLRTDQGSYFDWKETSKLTTASNQFMRLHAVRQSRTNFLDSLSDLNDTPDALLLSSVITGGPLMGAVTKFPRRYGFPNNFVQWYFSNVGLYYFVETHKDIVKSYMTCFVARLALSPNRTMRDVDLWASDNSILADYPADADDSNAATFLRLAAKFALTHGSDTWFMGNLAILKDLADKNIVSQMKPNNLVKARQSGYDAGLLEDNVEVWAGLQEFVKALVAKNQFTDAAIYQEKCNLIRDAINTVLWDETNRAWRIVDYNTDYYAHARSLQYYPDLQCQLFPQLYGLTHANGEAEMQRRYDGAWAWLETHKPNWWKSGSWNSHPNPEIPPGGTVHYPYSDLALAVVAGKRGQHEHSRSFMAFSLDRWITDPTRPLDPVMYPGNGTPIGTTIAEVGYWKFLLKGAIQQP
jgi:hypothetical protein